MKHQGPSRRIGPGCSGKLPVLGVRTVRLPVVWLWMLVCVGCPALLLAQHEEAGGNDPGTKPVQVIAIQGTNWWIAPSGAADWVSASARVPQGVRTGERIRTGRHTRLLLRPPSLGVIQIPPLSTIEIAPPPAEARSIWF